MKAHRKLLTGFVAALAGAFSFYLVPEAIAAAYIAFVYGYVAFKVLENERLRESAVFKNYNFAFLLILSSMGPAVNLVAIHEPMSHSLRVEIIMLMGGLIMAGMVTAQNKRGESSGA